MRRRRGLYVHSSMLAAIVRVGASGPRLDSMAIQVENCFITPRSIARFGGVEIPIGLMSARPCRNIDTGAATQDLTHRVRDRAAVQTWIRFGDKTPIQFAAKRHRPAVRIGNHVRLVAASGFQQKHAYVRICCKPRGDDRAGGTSTADDIVELRADFGSQGALVCANARGETLFTGCHGIDPSILEAFRTRHRARSDKRLSLYTRIRADEPFG